jgi:hypothetical protein
MAANPNTDFVAGAILTAAQQNRFGRGVMGYYVSTGNSAVGAATADITGATLTFTAVANRLYRASFNCDYSQTNAAAIIGFYLTDSAGTTTYHGIANTVSTNSGFAQVTLVHLFTASAGSVTRKIRADVSAGTATVRGAGGSAGSYSFTIEDLGPA